jgi:hypothetical protein
VGLIASVIFFRAWRVAIGGESLVPLWIIGVIPSILFWSSDLGKEPLILLGIAIATWGTLKLWRQPGLFPAVALVVGLVEIFFVRQWMALIFGAAAATAFILRPSSPIMRVVALALAAAVGVTTTIFASAIMESIGRQTFLEALEGISSSWAIGGSAQEAVKFSSVSDVIAFFPIGAFAALFRPLPGEISGAFGWLAGGENLLMLVLVGWAATRLIGRPWSFPLVLAVALVFWWTSIYAFLSYQNLGTAVRFKLQVVPFMVAIIGLGLQSTFPKARPTSRHD